LFLLKIMYIRLCKGINVINNVCLSMPVKKAKRIVLFGFLPLGGVLFLFIYSISSCQKNMDCTAVITIVDSTSRHNPISKATVSLQYNVVTPGKTNSVATQTTNSNGVATFVFKEPAIWDVNVTFQAITDTLSPPIKLIPGSTVSQTYTFQ
jgi:hypothetical protein